VPHEERTFFAKLPWQALFSAQTRVALFDAIASALHNHGDLGSRVEESPEQSLHIEIMSTIQTFFLSFFLICGKLVSLTRQMFGSTLAPAEQWG